MKYYLFWMVLSLGIHAGIFWAFNSTQQPAELPLRTGQVAVSVVLSNNAAEEPISEFSTTNMTPSPLKTGSVTTPDKTTKVQPVTVTDNTEARVTQTQSAKTPPQKKPLSAPLNNDTIAAIDHKLKKKTSESELETADVAQKQSQVSTAQISNPLPKGILTQAKPAATLSNSESIPAPEHKPDESISEAAPEIANVAHKSPQINASKTSNSQPEGVLTQAKVQSAEKPNYPRPAIMRNQQGKVTVQLLIDRNGKVQNAELLKSSGHNLLDKSVLRFVKQERFIPASKNGSSIDSSQLFSFRFVLE